MVENSIMTTDDFQEELEYYMALYFNDQLLDAGLISEETNEIAKRKIIDVYKPELASLMP